MSLLCFACSMFLWPSKMRCSCLLVMTLHNTRLPSGLPHLVRNCCLSGRCVLSEASTCQRSYSPCCAKTFRRSVCAFIFASFLCICVFHLSEHSGKHTSNRSHAPDTIFYMHIAKFMETPIEDAKLCVDFEFAVKKWTKTAHSRVCLRKSAIFGYLEATARQIAAKTTCTNFHQACRVWILGASVLQP